MRDSHAIDRLHAEWARLRLDPLWLAHANGWKLRPVRDLDEWLAIVEHDQQLALRLAVTATTDTRAARVLLQGVLPRIVGLAQRIGSRPYGAAPVDELVAATWLAIATFRLTRRPTRVAAALVNDAYCRVYRRPAQPMVTSITGYEHRLVDRPPWCGFDELMRTLSGIEMSDTDRVTLAAILRHDRARDAARELRITPRALRLRQARLAARVRAAVATSAAAGTRGDASLKTR